MQPKLFLIQLNLNLTGEPSCIEISLHAETIVNANNGKYSSIECFNESEYQVSSEAKCNDKDLQ